MKICRVEISDGRIEYGIVINGEVYSLESGKEPARLGARLGKLEELKLKVPVLPGKVVGVGLNYKAHAEEMKQKLPDEPIIFIKPRTSVIGPGDPILLTPQSTRVEYEAELAIVLYKSARNVKVEDAPGYILGYTCCNDVSARDLQAKDGQWTRAKGFDSFCPIGPWVETELNPANLKIEARLNNQVVQQCEHKRFEFQLRTTGKLHSSVMTLEPRST